MPPPAEPLPTDRSHVPTEQRSARSQEFDTLGTTDAVRLMIDDHRDVAAALDHATPSLASFLEDLVPRVRAGGRLIYLGAGTSGRLGVLDASECPPTFRADPGQVVGIIAGGEASLRRSSEGREDEPDGAAAALTKIGLDPNDTVVGIAAGGTTPYVLGALAFARAGGAMTALLTCAADAVEPAVCDHLLAIDTGPELLTGSTRLKAGSATKLALNVISTVLFTQLGKVYSNLMVDLRATNDKLADRAIRILLELCPNLGREEAAATLDRAEGRLKVAITMHRLGLERVAAEATLARHDGSLRATLETPDTVATRPGR